MSAGEAHHELIIIKRVEEDEHEHHSSAWKVAHADFMTAMMAFFLIMWLINVTDENVRKGISEYFNPVHLSQGQSEQKGLNDPEDSGADPGEARGNAKPGLKDPPKKKGQAGARGTEPEGDHVETGPAEKGKAASGAAKPSSATLGPAGKTAGLPETAQQPSPAAAERSAREFAALSDPFAVLARLEASAANAGGLTATSDGSRPAAAGPDRDPFDPSYWQTRPALASRPEFEQPAERRQAVPETPAPAAQSSPTAERPSPAANSAAKPDEADPAGRARAAELASELGEALRTSAGGPLPALKVEATGEGVLVSLTDNADFAMFGVGSTIPDPRLVRVMGELAKALAARPGDIVIRGHTDGRPFRSEVYDNWRLSAARAQMAHYMLVRGGLDPRRIVAVEGRADRNLKNPADAYAAENRRIEILVRVPPS